MSLTETETLVDEDLPQQVCCICFTPRPNYLSIGAYELDLIDSSVRTGLIYLLKLNSSIPGGFEIKSETKTSAILDMKWDQFDTLAVASSDAVQIFKFSGAKDELSLVTELKITKMALFIQWMDETQILYSDSEGYVNLCEFENDSLKPKLSCKLHESLTWVVHYSSLQEVFYAGDDMGILHAFTFRDFSNSSNHFTKKFNAGITSVSTNNELIAIGCYDDHLRLYDLTGTIPKVRLNLLHEINLGGCPWRTQFLPTTQDSQFLIACACARNGVQMLRFDPTNKTLEVIKTITNYTGNLAYGLDVKIDWKSHKYTVANCYFDNHVVHIWEMPIE